MIDRLHLRWQVVLCVGALQALALAGAAWMLLANAETAVEVEMAAAESSARAQVIAAVGAAMQDHPPEEVLGVLSERLVEPRHARLALFDSRSGPLPVLSGTRGAEDGTAPGWFRALVTPPVRETRLSILENGRDHGFVSLTTAPQDEIDEVWRDASALFWTLGAAFLATVVLVMAVIRRALRPLETLNRGLGALQSGRLSTRISGIRGRDFAPIVGGFNALSQSLEQSEAARAALKGELETWSRRFHTLMDRALPDPPWGPARLDAVSMIFNRLAGLDIGPETQDYLIPDNIAVADAPTRYPFLWNAARQDYTQWPGFAKNGNELLGLARNLGEVYGVFGEFHPEPKSGLGFSHDYISRNSANFDGLRALETWIWDIGAPRWPWALDRELVRQGQAIFNRPVAAGGCVACHGKRRGERRALFHSTFATPILDVGTDTRECQILARTVETGVLEGASIPLLRKELGARAPAFEVLGVSVIGAIIQQATSFGGTGTEAATAGSEALADDEFMSRFEDLRGAFPLDGTGTGLEAGGGCKYEARVLDGIWAAAPYLHNGAVPSLRELLTPPEDRVTAYAPGPAYDIDAVGMAVEQTAFGQVIETTGCDDLSSGNSRCGHPYGTGLAEAEKRALLEYLKSI